jgi:hypothetical protein
MSGMDDAVGRRTQLDHSPDFVLTDVKIGFDNVLAREFIQPSCVSRRRAASIVSMFLLIR